MNKWAITGIIVFVVSAMVLSVITYRPTWTHMLLMGLVGIGGYLYGNGTAEKVKK